jgi:hypothetical protein
MKRNSSCSGYARDVYSEIDNREWIPSYGVGLRFLVLKSKRINMRHHSRNASGIRA